MLRLINRMSLRAKLLGTLGFLCIGVVSEGALNYWFSNRITAEYHQISGETLTSANMIGDMRMNSQAAAFLVASLAHPGIPAEIRTKMEKDLQARFEGFEKASQAYSKFADSDAEERKLFDELSAAWQEKKKELEGMIPLTRSDKPEDQAKLRQILTTTFLDSSEKLTAKMDEVLHKQEVETQETLSRVDSWETLGNRIGIFLIFGGLFSSVALSYFLVRWLGHRLADLTERLTREAGEVASISGEISGSSAELSSGATQQASALQETSASLEQISQMVNQNAENAQKSKTVAEMSHATAAEGKSNVDEMIASIRTISESNERIFSQVDEGNRQISEIVRVISEIGEKTKVINDIVFQTKLLSFNASVEAARAGEHGKGFAVVAEEVGNLAQMSGNAAKEISTLLESSTSKVELIVSNMRSQLESLSADGKSKVDSGLSIAARCGASLEEIVRAAGEMRETIGQISNASNEQSIGVREIASAIRMMDEVTSKNSVLAQTSSSASGQLDRQSQELQAMIDDLKRLVNGETDGDPREASSEGPGFKAKTLLKAAQAVATKATPKVKPKTSSSPASSEPKVELSVAPAKVVPLKAKTQARAAVVPPPAPKAAPKVAKESGDHGQVSAGGGVMSVPSEADPRFREA